jgi:hypothetical protein
VPDWFCKPKVYRLISLLRLLGDRKSADAFVRHLQAIDKANASPEGINEPKAHISDMEKYRWDSMAGGYRELRVFECLNDKGKFVATTDRGKNWYLTGEDDTMWRKDKFDLGG